jgi:lysozyme family protein
MGISSVNHGKGAPQSSSINYNSSALKIYCGGNDTRGETEYTLPVLTHYIPLYNGYSPDIQGVASLLCQYLFNTSETYSDIIATTF